MSFTKKYKIIIFGGTINGQAVNNVYIINLFMSYSGDYIAEFD